MKRGFFRGHSTDRRTGGQAGVMGRAPVHAATRQFGLRPLEQKAQPLLFCFTIDSF